MAPTRTFRSHVTGAPKRAIRGDYDRRDGGGPRLSPPRSRPKSAFTPPRDARASARSPAKLLGADGVFAERTR
jgi:hypothetical protein